MELYKRDIDFLMGNLKDVSILRKLEVFSSTSEESGTKKLTIFFDENELDALEDGLFSLLCEIGISENNEVNAQGIYIERLIDLVREQYN